MLQRISRQLRVSLIPFVGRSWLSPFVPIAKPITVVVGTPIRAGPPVPRPSQEQVDALHLHFCSELRRIFDKFKSAHPGFEHKRLFFDDEVERYKPSEEAAQRRLESFHLFPSPASGMSKL